MFIIDIIRKVLVRIAVTLAGIFGPIFSFLLHILVWSIWIAFSIGSLNLFAFSVKWSLNFIGIGTDIGWWMIPVAMLIWTVDGAIIVIVGWFLYMLGSSLLKYTKHNDKHE